MRSGPGRKRFGEWLLWDTGIEDDLIKGPEGRILAHGIRGILREHTLGHSSLLVRLPQSGPVLLSADGAHNRDNFVHCRSPVFNADQRAGAASSDKVDSLLRAEGATMWVNHDTAQSETLPHAPLSIA